MAAIMENDTIPEATYIACKDEHSYFSQVLEKRTILRAANGVTVPVDWR